MRSVAWRVNRFREKWQLTIVSVGLVAVAAGGFAQNTQAIRASRQATIDNCVRDRTDLDQGLTAVANVLIDTSKSSPDNQTPERQAEIEAYRKRLIRDFNAGSADPEDCE